MPAGPGTALRPGAATTGTSTTSTPATAATTTRTAAFIGHSIGADDEERFGFAVGDQVVHDQVGVSLVHPSGFVLTPAVLQIEHRVAGGLILVIARRGVDKCAA